MCQGQQETLDTQRQVRQSGSLTCSCARSFKFHNIAYDQQRTGGGSLKAIGPNQFQSGSRAVPLTQACHAAPGCERTQHQQHQHCNDHGPAEQLVQAKALWDQVLYQPTSAVALAHQNVTCRGGMAMLRGAQGRVSTRPEKHERRLSVDRPVIHLMALLQRTKSW